MDVFFRYLVPIVLAVFLAAMLSIFSYITHIIPQETKDLVQRFTMAQEKLDFETLKKIYASNAMIKFEYIYPDDAPNKNLEANAHHVLNIAQKTKMLTRHLNDYSDYSDIEYEWIEKSIQVSSIRYSHKTKQKTPHILMLSQDRKKRWWIMEEYIIEYTDPPFE